MNPTTPQHRRSTDPKSLGGRVARLIGNAVRMTNHGLRALLGRRVGQVQRQLDPQSLAILREHLLGSSKQAVCDLLGRPPMCEQADGQIGPSSEAFLGSDTWYFPLDEQTGTILVARFEDDLAVDAQFVEAPAVR